MQEQDDFDLEHLDINEDIDYSQKVIDNEIQPEVDNDCGDACKL